jgi:hypothetical protein
MGSQRADRTRTQRWRAAGAGKRRVGPLAAAAALLLAACAPRGVPFEGPVDPALEARAVAATAPAGPLLVRFNWTMRERDARFTGQGVTRMAPPDRARLDLFGPRGEGYLSAALVGDQFRLQPGAVAAPLPPPPLLWSAIGSFRPPPGARLVAAFQDGESTRLHYADGTDRWRFTLEADRLRSAELDRAGARHTVELRGTAAAGLPQEAAYRDWSAFVELTLTLTDAENVASFPEDTWWPGR